MTITQIPKTNIFYGDSTTESKEFEAKGIKNIFFLPSIIPEEILKVRGAKLHTYTEKTHPLLAPAATIQLVAQANKLQTNFAIICMVGADTSPMLAATCLLGRGYTPKQVKDLFSAAKKNTWHGRPTNINWIVNEAENTIKTYCNSKLKIKKPKTKLLRTEAQKKFAAKRRIVRR